MSATMKTYIDRSVSVSRANLACGSGLVQPLLDLLRACSARSLAIVASGSSYNATQIALPFMRSCLGAGLHVRVVTPFTFAHADPELVAADLTVVVTQSGRSTNAIEAIELIHERGGHAICLTGDISSSAARHSDVALDYGVGIETVGYVTLGVTTLVVYWCALALELSGLRERASDIETALDVADWMKDHTPQFFENHKKALLSPAATYLCGALGSWGVAIEGALKMGETIHVPCIACEIEEFIHGPNLQFTPAYSVFLFDPLGSSSSRTQEVHRAARAVSDRSYLITAGGINGAGDENVMCAPFGCVPELASLAYLPFVQLISYLVSDALGSERVHPLLEDFKALASAKVVAGG